MGEKKDAGSGLRKPPRHSRHTILPRTTRRIFRAWTQPEALKEWWCPSGWKAAAIEVDLRVGGEHRIAMRRARESAEVSVLGHFLEVRPPQRLRYRWRWEGAFERMPDTLVTVEFLVSGSGTELTLCHESFVDA